MFAGLRLHHQATSLAAELVLLGLLLMQNTFANDPMPASASSWIVMECSAETSQVQLVHDSRKTFVPDWPTFVITHGMGGTVTGDRFHQLADAIDAAIPKSNVLIIDWSKQSWRTLWLGIPNPLAVARNIDPVARDASSLLKAIKLEPERTTFIGESFGNCVNAQIAKALNRRGHILAFNPAHEAGGYKTPDLKECSDLAWSFQTYSIFDTQDSIADVGIFLETSPMATDCEQHIAGVLWLSQRVIAGDLAWLLTLHDIPTRNPDNFDAVGTLSGELLCQPTARKRAAPDDSHPRSPLPMIVAFTATVPDN